MMPLSKTYFTVLTWRAKGDMTTIKALQIGIYYYPHSTSNVFGEFGRQVVLVMVQR
jgi:hypothetical protein